MENQPARQIVHQVDTYGRFSLCLFSGRMNPLQGQGRCKTTTGVRLTYLDLANGLSTRQIICHSYFPQKKVLGFFDIEPSLPIHMVTD